MNTVLQDDDRIRAMLQTVLLFLLFTLTDLSANDSEFQNFDFSEASSASRTQPIKRIKTAGAISTFIKFKEKLNEAKSKDSSLLDRLVNIVVSTLGIPLKKPPPVSGKGLQFLSEGARNAWYTNLTNRQKKGLDYFNQSTKVFDSDPKKALELVEKSLEFFPEYGEAIRDRLVLRYDLGLPGAEEPPWFKRSRESKEWIEEARAICFIDPTQALDFAIKAIDVDPTNDKAYLERDLLQYYISFGELSYEFMSEDLLQRYIDQSRHLEGVNLPKAIKLLIDALKFSPDSQVALNQLKNLKRRSALEKLNRAKEVLKVDLSKAYEIISEVAKLDQESDQYRIFMKNYADQIIDFGLSLSAKSKERSIAVLETACKYSLDNKKCSESVLNLKNQLVSELTSGIDALFLTRDPDEFKIIEMINKIQSYIGKSAEFSNQGLIAEKLYSYAKYYIEDDPSRAIRIIAKSIELNPGIRGIATKKKQVLQNYAGFVSKKIENLILATVEVGQLDASRKLFKDIRLLLEREFKSGIFDNSENLSNELFVEFRRLADKYAKNHPEIAYNLFKLFKYEFPKEIQVDVEMKKLESEVARSFLDKAMLVYGDNNRLAIELIMLGLNYDPENSELIRSLEHLKLDMDLE